MKTSREDPGDACWLLQVQQVSSADSLMVEATRNEHKRARGREEYSVVVSPLPTSPDAKMSRLVNHL